MWKKTSVDVRSGATPEIRKQVSDVLDCFRDEVLRAIDEGRDVHIDMGQLFYRLAWMDGRKLIETGHEYDTQKRTLEVRIGWDPQCKAKAMKEWQKQQQEEACHTTT